MKKLLASVGALVLAAGANAQNSGDSNGLLHDSVADYTTGTNGTQWKVGNPSGPSDWWNSFKSTDLNGIALDALAGDWLENGGIPGAHAALGIYRDLGGGAPDVSAAGLVVGVAPAINAGDASNTDAFYSIPKTTLTSGSYHIAAQYVSGDSHCWMGSDSSAPIGRTFFTATGYAGGAIPFTTEIDLYAGGARSAPAGCLLFNGATTASVTNLETVCVQFFGPAVSTRFLLYFCVNGNPFLQLLPGSATVTDNFFGGSCPGSWQVCQTLDCNTPTGSGLEFCTIYADKTDLKPSGKPKLKLGKSAFLNISQDARCGGGSGCFGQKDDCILDGNIWKVQNPAGPSDWFNVNHGVPTSGVTSLTSVGCSSYDFCGFGPCWAEVGIYPSNITLDPAGATPDVANPLSNVTGAAACMAPSAADGTCPTTVYDGADVPVGAATANGVNSAVHWPAGDSCIWLGSDTDGVDSPCGEPIPNTGLTSLFTLSSYTSPAVRFSAANWMMQINWN